MSIQSIMQISHSSMTAIGQRYQAEPRGWPLLGSRIVSSFDSWSPSGSRHRDVYRNRERERHRHREKVAGDDYR